MPWGRLALQGLRPEMHAGHITAAVQPIMSAALARLPCSTAACLLCAMRQTLAGWQCRPTDECMQALHCLRPGLTDNSARVILRSCRVSSRWPFVVTAAEWWLLYSSIAALAGQSSSLLTSSTSMLCVSSAQWTGVCSRALTADRSMGWWLSRSQRSSSALLLSVLRVTTGLMQKSAITADVLQYNQQPVSPRACGLNSNAQDLHGPILGS